LITVDVESVPAQSGGAALVIGASGGIGAAVLRHYLSDNRFEQVVAVSRSARPRDLSPYGDKLNWMRSDYGEASIAEMCQNLAASTIDLRRVVICNGILHKEDLQPEKAIEKLRSRALLEVFESNAVGPLLWLSALAGQLRRSTDCIVAVLSARVGSIGDNRLGGWYSYRASKAALNMLLKTAAIEYARRAPRVKLVAFHPGTTDTALSRPFQRNVPEEKLFAPEFVALRLVTLLDQVKADGELSFLDWDGKPIPW